MHEAHEEHEVFRARGVRGHHFVPARGASEPRSHNRSFDSAERRIPSSCPSWLFQRSPVVNALSGEPFGNGALVPSAGCQITTRSTNVALTSRHSLPATLRLRGSARHLIGHPTLISRALPPHRDARFLNGMSRTRVCAVRRPALPARFLPLSVRIKKASVTSHRGFIKSRRNLLSRFWHYHRLGKLNCCVRDGNRCVLSDLITGKSHDAHR